MTSWSATRAVMRERTVEVGRLSEIDDPGSIEFRIGNGDWPCSTMFSGSLPVNRK